MLALIIIVLFWAGNGVTALVLDWTRDFDLKTSDAVMCAMCGAVLGPVAWLLFAIGSMERKPQRVLMRRRLTRD